MRQICEEKNISYESVLETVESALAAAFRKDFGNKNQNIKVQFDPEAYDGGTHGIRVFDVKMVVADMELPEGYFERFEAAYEAKRLESKIVPRTERDPAKDENSRKLHISTDVGMSEPTEDEFAFNQKTMIMLSDARDLKPDAQIEDEIRVELRFQPRSVAWQRKLRSSDHAKLREAERTSSSRTSKTVRAN